MNASTKNIDVAAAENGGHTRLMVVLMPFGSVGSNLLVNMWHVVPDVFFVNEPLTRVQTECWAQWGKDTAESDAEIERRQLQYLQHWFSTPQHSTAVAGVKLSVDSLHTPAVRHALCALLRQHATRSTLVCMHRSNAVRCGVSIARKHVYAARTGYWGVDKNAEPLECVALDPAEVVKYTRRCAARAAQLDALVRDCAVQEQDGAPLRVHNLDYDEWTRSPERIRTTAERLLMTQCTGGAHAAQIGDVCQRAPLPYKKATPHNLRQAVANYDEVRAALVQAGFERDVLDAEHDCVIENQGSEQSTFELT